MSDLLNRRSLQKEEAQLAEIFRKLDTEARQIVLAKARCALDQEKGENKRSDLPATHPP